MSEVPLFMGLGLMCEKTKRGAGGCTLHEYLAYNHPPLGPDIRTMPGPCGGPGGERSDERGTRLVGEESASAAVRARGVSTRHRYRQKTV